MKSLYNEKGGALLYVLMIVIVLGLFTPVILSTISQNETTERRNEQESKVIQLAVSGMEAFINFSSDPLEQKSYLEDQYNENIQIQLPEGDTIVYRHFVVPESMEDSDVLDAAAPVPFNEIDNNFYKVVITVANASQVKTLTRILDLTITATERTATPLIYQLIAGETVVKGRAEAGASIKVMRDTTVIGTGEANGTLIGSDRNYEMTISGSLVEGENINVTATETSRPKLESFVASRLVDAAAAPPDDGLVAIIVVDAEGNETVTYKEFENVESTEDTLVIYNNESGTATYSDNTTIELSGDEGIVINPDVTIQTTSNGDGNLTFESTGGNITMKDANIINNGNAAFNEIRIEAAGDVNIEGATIIAERDVVIIAGGNIYAEGASISSIKSQGSISLELNPYTSGNKIYVNGLSLNKNASGSPSSLVICGELSSGTINSTSNFGSCE
jgi:hypothetical protein